MFILLSKVEAGRDAMWNALWKGGEMEGGYDVMLCSLTTTIFKGHRDDQRVF